MSQLPISPHDDGPRSRPNAYGVMQPDGRTGQLPPVDARRLKRAKVARLLSLASAVLIIIGGFVHYCLYYNHGYRFIPKIGVGFLLQFSSSAIIALALLVLPRAKVRLGHHSVSLAQPTRLAAIGLSIGTLAALGIAHTSQGLFGFREIGLQPAPETLIAIVVESLAAVLLSVAVLQAWRGHPGGRSTGQVAPPRRRAVPHAA
jgi:hypothetical protein